MNFKFLFKNNINDNRLMQQPKDLERGTAGSQESDTIKFNGNWKTAIEQMKQLAMKVSEQLLNNDSKEN